MDRLETVNAEIDTLENSMVEKRQEYTALENELARSASPDEAKLRRLPALEAGIRVSGQRIELLKQNKAALEREAQFDQFETLTRGQFEHFTQIATLDKEVTAIQERLNEIAKKRSEMNSANHSPFHRRSKLYVSLIQHATPEELERLRQIQNKYKVARYL